MSDDISDIQAFYNKNVEKEDGRLELHPVECNLFDYSYLFSVQSEL